MLQQKKKGNVLNLNVAHDIPLYELPYYNAISSCIVDPMHTLFLGIAKRFFNVWCANHFLSEKNFSLIQSKVDAFNCPPDIGRIPYKIGSRFSGLKADQ